MIRSCKASEEGHFFPNSTDESNHAKILMYSCLSHTDILDIHSLFKSIIKRKKLFP